MMLFDKDKEEGLESEFDAMPEESSLSKYMREHDETKGTKTAINAVGSVLQGFADVPTGYEMIYGKKIQKANPKEALSQAANMIEDPSERKKKAYEYLKMKNDGIKLNDENALRSRDRDPESKESKALKSLAPRWGIKVTPEMTAYDIKQMIDPKKMMETEAQSSVNFENQKKLGEINHRYDMQKLTATQTAEAAKKAAENGKLSDTQVSGISDLDVAESDLNNLVTKLGNNSEWTGTLDGRTPDLLIGKDQVAWRSALGKFKDQYRKAITGAGAGPNEIAKLESRLPSETDTLADFQAKAAEAISGLKRQKQVTLENLKKVGKNTAKFEGAPQQKTVSKTLRNKRTGETKVVYSDGSEEIISTAGN